MAATTQPAGGFGTPVAISGTQTPAFGETMSADAAGDTIVAWANIHGIWAAVKPADTATFGAPQRLTRKSVAPNAGPLIAFGPAGEAIATWTATDGQPMYAVYHLREPDPALAIDHTRDARETDNPANLPPQPAIAFPQALAGDPHDRPGDEWMARVSCRRDGPPGTSRRCHRRASFVMSSFAARGGHRSVWW